MFVGSRSCKVEDMHALAPNPNRASTSFTLSWGLLNIPVSAFAGTEEVRVARKEFTTNGDPVGRAVTNKTTGDVIDRADVIKKAEASNGVWVELDDAEIAAATMERGSAVIESFVLAKNTPQYLTEGLYQVRAKRVK